MAAIRNPNIGSSQMRAKKRRLFFVRLYIILFIFLVIIFTLALLSGHEKIKIQTIIVSNTASVQSEAVLDIVRRDITGRYFYLFSKSNFLIFPRFKIKADILREIREIEDLDIFWSDWQKISINLIERKPHSVWCGYDVKVVDQECYLVDKNGYIYTKAPIFSGNIFIKDYGLFLADASQSTSTAPIGKNFLPTVLYSSIFKIIDLLGQHNLRVNSVSFDGFDFRFILDIGPTIIFNNKNKASFELSFDNLLRAVETGDLAIQEKATEINYLDLRFDNKIIIGKKVL